MYLIINSIKKTMCSFIVTLIYDESSYNNTMSKLGPARQLSNQFTFPHCFKLNKIKCIKSSTVNYCVSKKDRDQRNKHMRSTCNFSLYVVVPKGTVLSCATTLFVELFSRRIRTRYVPGVSRRRRRPWQ